MDLRRVGYFIHNIPYIFMYHVISWVGISCDIRTFRSHVFGNFLCLVSRVLSLYRRFTRGRVLCSTRCGSYCSVSYCLTLKMPPSETSQNYAGIALHCPCAISPAPSGMLRNIIDCDKRVLNPTGFHLVRYGHPGYLGYTILKWF